MRTSDEPIRVRVLASDPLVQGGLEVLARESGAEVVSADPEVALVTGDELVDEVPTVVLASDEGEAARARAAGALGVLSRGVDAQRLGAALAAVAVELFVADPVFAQSERAARPTPDLVESFTPREDEVLALLAEGLSNRKIAKQLEISEHTVKFHVNAILEKMDADTRTEAVVRAARMGLLLL
jgi:DNA-binding NarL/FixJ family response regulator